MGMFDYVKVEVPLPDSYEPENGLLQTKDLDCQMTTYTISKEGRLVSDDWHYEDVPHAERTYPDAPEGSLQSFIGCLKKVVDRKDVDRNFHGILNFYDGEEIGGTWQWHEYNAKFTDGQLVSIEVVSQ